MPSTFGRRKRAEVSLKRVVLHSRATETRGSVAQACGLARSGDEKCGFRCRRVSFILTSFCLAPLGGGKVRKCRPSVSCCTLGRRKRAEMSPKRAAWHVRATKSVGFVAEESPSFLCHSVLHLWAAERCGSVAQACRAALSGDGNAQKCRPSVWPGTFGRRKVPKALPRSVARHSPLLRSLEGFKGAGCRVRRPLYSDFIFGHNRSVFGNFYYFCPDACHGVTSRAGDARQERDTDRKGDRWPPSCLPKHR